jgi:hypothetical protein
MAADILCRIFAIISFFRLFDPVLFLDFFATITIDMKKAGHGKELPGKITVIARPLP